jgi:hypothetical protein
MMPELLRKSVAQEQPGQKTETRTGIERKSKLRIAIAAAALAGLVATAVSSSPRGGADSGVSPCGQPDWPGHLS